MYKDGKQIEIKANDVSIEKNDDALKIRYNWAKTHGKLDKGSYNFYVKSKTELSMFKVNISFSVNDSKIIENSKIECSRI